MNVNKLFIIIGAFSRLALTSGSLYFISKYGENSFPKDIVNVVAAISLVGMLATYGLCFDFYLSGADQSNEEHLLNKIYLPVLSLRTCLAVISTGLCGSIACSVFSGASVVKIISIELGSLVFGVSYIYGNFFTGLGRPGVAAGLFSIPGGSLAIIFLLNKSFGFDAYVSTIFVYCPIAICSCLYYLAVRDSNTVPESNTISIKSSGRLGKLVASASQPALFWLLVNSLVGRIDPSTLAMYFSIQRFFDGITSFWMIILQHRTIPRLIKITTIGKTFPSTRYAFSRLMFLFLSFLIIGGLVSYVLKNAETEMYEHISSNIYLESMSSASKILLGLVSILAMRNVPARSLHLEAVTLLTASFIIILFSSSIAKAQFGIILSYVFSSVVGIVFVARNFNEKKAV